MSNKYWRNWLWLGECLLSTHSYKATLPSPTPRNLMIELQSHSKLFQNSLPMFPIHSAPVIPKYTQRIQYLIFLSECTKKGREPWTTILEGSSPLLWLIRMMGFSVPVSSRQKSPLRISALESQPLLFRSHYLKNTEVPPLPHPHMWQGRWAEGGEDGEGTGRTMGWRPPSSCLSSTLSAVLRAQSAKWTALSMSLWGTPET